jgi:hypothetical protein
MLLTFRVIGFGWNGDGILLDPTIQSTKLIAVWTQLDPLPLIVTQPALMAAGLITFGVVHAAIYRSVARAWPPGIVPRALRMAFVLFALSFAFWEFFTPFNQLGEPFLLIALELSFWAVMALAEAFTLAALLEPREDRWHFPLSDRPLIRQHDTATDNASHERDSRCASSRPARLGNLWVEDRRRDRT